MKNYIGKRLLSLVLVVALCLSVALPAGAVGTADSSKISFEKVDNDEVSAKPSLLGEIEETSEPSPYGEDETVRVSIILEKDSTLAFAEEKNIAVENIATNSAAVSYRNSLKTAQVSVANEIAQTLDVSKLDVVWNLTLAANLISANVKYGQIEAIKSVPGVQDVVVETRYEPAVVSKGSADPNMATSSAMIGSAVAYAEGYTGAGSRIAVIDTGIDDDHQSFDAGAYEYSLQELAEKAGMSYDAYVASLNLLTAAEVASVADQLNAKIDAEKTYLTSKVPYAYNYVDDDYDINHDNDTQGEHGSHVTGIAAANRYIPNGDGTYSAALDTVVTQGVAPDAQIITMKVFGKGGGAYDSDYMVAIEDAIVLGADAINLSLGSGNAGLTTSGEYQYIMDSLAESGVIVTMSAGNSYSWGENSYNFAGYNAGYGYPYSDDVNFDTVGSPSAYTNSFSIASAENTGSTGAFITVGESAVFYTETSGYANAPMTTIAGEQEYVMIDGVGTEEEFAAIKDVLTGKIAVCSRGTTSFFEKANAAVANGAIATIIVNNQAGTISMNLDGYVGPAPCVSVTQADGALLRENATYVEAGDYYLGTLTVSSKIASVSNPDADVVMSDFSSWGVPGSLELKPEITAPGGNIYSVNGAIAGGTSYELMSGTSMAAPQVAGMTALVAQYIRENNLTEKTGLTARQLGQSLLMSTAEPLLEADSGYNYYSILKQGAGLANVGAAVSADTYILMDADATASYADGKVKAELGDDPEKTGTYSFSFTVNNLTDEEQTYDLSADLFTQDVFDWYVSEAYEVGGYLDTWTAALNAVATWTVDGKTISPDGQALLGMDFDGNGVINNNDATALLEYVTGVRTSVNDQENADFDGDGEIDTYDAYLFLKRLSEGVVTVAANDSVKITVTLQLTAEQMAELDANYPNGAYVEGFVYVKGLTTGEGVQGTTHSIPVLAFYGNWTDASMFDHVTWTEFLDAEAKGTVTRWNYMGTYYSDYVAIKYPGESKEYAFGGNPVLYEEYDASRNAVNSDTTLSKVVYSLIRNAGAGRLTLTNTTTGEAELDKILGASYAAYYYVNGGAWYNTSASQSLGIAPQGEEGDTYELNLTMAPEYYLDAEGNVDWDALGDGATLSIPFTIDNTAPVLEDVTESLLDNTLTIQASDNQYLAAIILLDTNGETVAALLPEQSAAGETVQAKLDALEDGLYYVQMYDYAMNVSTFRLFLNVKPTNEVESVELNKSQLSLMKGTTASLTATVLPATVSDDSVTWSSSDTNIATVNDNGLVTGVSVGTCEITATSVLDPEKSATCAVTVKSANVTLYGALQDEDGSPLLFTWDMENDRTWTSYAELDTNLASMTWDWLDDDMPLYQQNGSGYMYKVDVDSGETLAQSESVVAFGDPMQDMDFAFYHYSTTGEPLTFGVCGAYLLGPNAPLDNTFTSGWNLASFLATYTGGSKFVALTWGGIDSQYRDVLYALDDAGYLWLLRYNGTSSINLGFIETDLDLTFPTYDGSQFCSMVFDDNLDVLYLSYFTGSTNEIYMLEFNASALSFEATLIGDVGDGVWPASLFAAMPNEGAETSAITAYSAAVPSYSADAITVVNALNSVATVPSETLDLSAPNGSLNSVVSTGSSTVRPMSDTVVEDEEDTVILDVTAKNAAGEDVASYNGKLTVNYDSEIFALKSVEVHAAYSSYNDSTEGEVVIAYAGTTEIPAGASVATVVLTRKTSGAGSISIDHEEVGDENPAYEELVPINYTEEDHVWGEWEVTTEPTCEEPGVETRTCEKCGETETREIPALGHDYQWINEKQPTLFEDGYSGDLVCVHCGDVLEKGHVIPATGSAILPVLPSVPSVSKPTAPMPFTDVSVGDWFYDAVEYVYEEGLMNGTSDTKFSPNATLTRGMVVTILHRMEGAPATRYNATFSDVPNYEWYTDGVEWAAKYDIVTGYTTGKFGPEDPVTREQLAAILYRYAEYKGYDVSKTADLSGYTDGANVSEYAKTNVAWAVANGILESANGKLRPRENAIRAEVALAVAEFHQQYVK